ncbi:amidohydrolase family protein [Alicyclobacillus curvatus]|nr:amidohydrolase family protein [Alicyclobacillus curvatus]
MVALGTDGAGSTITLDMFEEMKAAAWMHKNAAADPTAVSTSDVLTMATTEGSKVLNLADQIGTLEVGKKADIILIDMANKPHLSPITNNLYALLAYSEQGSDVNTSIINGKVVMRNREILTFDVREVVRQVQGIVERLL